MTAKKITLVVKADERSGGRTGRRGYQGVAGKRGRKGREIWRTESTTRLQTADSGKGQWFATEFMGKFLKHENGDPVRFSKEFR